MISKYFIPQDRPTRHAEFTDCIIKSDESVGKFFDRLNALAYACSGTDAKIWTVFYRGLIPANRDKMPIPEPLWTVQDLVSKATAAQQYI